MDIHFFNGQHDPKPREEIEIEDIRVTPYSDGQRVKVEVDVTPFRERPNMLLVIHNDDDQLVSELNIIETMHFNMEFTMHLRNVQNPVGAYSLSVELFYETRTPPQAHEIEGFIIEAANLD